MQRDKAPVVGHILDRRHRKGKIKVPEEKKALPAVDKHKIQELKEVGICLHIALSELDEEPLGISRREQELVSQSCNWAGYLEYPKERNPRATLAPMTVKEYVHHAECPREVEVSIMKFESFYAVDPPVSNFREEFGIVFGKKGMHLYTMVPVSNVPYTPGGHQPIHIGCPLDGPDWLPV